MAYIALRPSMALQRAKTNVCGAFGTVTAGQKRELNTEMNVDMLKLKRGRGGRSSFSGVVATVFGGSGSLGTTMINKLGKIGSQVIIPYRHDPYYVRDTRVSGDLGQLLYCPFDLRDEESLRKSMRHSNVVVNCIGKEHETKNFSFHDTHVESARKLARLARECGVKKFIHVSSLNATPDPPTFFTKGGSQYLKTKYEGEIAVREEFPDAVIFRPADTFGRYDRFIRYYASPLRRITTTKNAIPLWKKGNATTKQPVYFADVCEGMFNAILDPSADGKTYDCLGPHRYFLSDLVEWFYKILRNQEVHIRENHLTTLIKAHLVQTVAWKESMLNVDKLERDYISDAITDNPTLVDLGVKLTPIEEHANHQLLTYKNFLSTPQHIGKWQLPADPPKYTDYPDRFMPYY